MSALASTPESASYRDQAVVLLRRSGFLFVATSVSLVVLEGLEAARVLSNPVQGGLSFAITLCAVVVVVCSCVRLRTATRLHWGLYILISTGALYMLISWTEDLTFLNEIPVFGQNDKVFRKMTKIVLLALWFTSPPFIAWNMITVHRQLTDELEDRVAQRTRCLSEANDRLQTEIREHLSTGNELKASQTKLAALLEQRSQQLAVVEQELIRHERLKALGQMASGVAHELNNALVPIKAYVELLIQCGDLTQEQAAWLQIVDQATEDASHVVRSLQQFHGKEASGSPRESLDPAHLIHDVVELTRPVWKDAAEAAGKRILIQEEVEANLKVYANASELRQVMTNLILNSVDAIQDKGTIRLQLESVNDTAEFRVVDDGDGMDAKQRGECMEPFFTTKVGGTGLGLSVCDGIVQNHGGCLEVDSSPDGGTTFRFRLPLDRRESAFSDTAVSAEQPSLKALYVEDDANVRQAFAALLTSLGLSVVVAESGMQAITIVEESLEFDLLIVDMGMPEMNGVETISALKERGLNCASVVVSGWSVESVIDRFGQQPLPEFILTKPVSIRDLEHMLKEVGQI